MRRRERIERSQAGGVTLEAGADAGSLRSKVRLRGTLESAHASRNLETSGLRKNFSRLDDPAGAFQNLSLFWLLLFVTCDYG